LSDLLASYEVVPGTVFQAGYGSLYEKQVEQPGTAVPNNLDGKYLTVSRGLFFKASYLHRFLDSDGNYTVANASLVAACRGQLPISRILGMWPVPQKPISDKRVFQELDSPRHKL